MSPRRGGGCLGDALSGPPRRPIGGSSSAQPGAPQPSPAAAAAWRSRAPAAAPGASQPPPGARGEGGGRPPGKMKAEGGDHSMINLSVQQVLSLWAHGTVLRNLTEMWYWIFLWALFSSLFVHGAAGVLMFVMLQRHRQGRVISVVAVSIGFLASVTGAMITSLLRKTSRQSGNRQEVKAGAGSQLETREHNKLHVQGHSSVRDNAKRMWARGEAKGMRVSVCVCVRGCTRA
ncbi:transmembrane protein 170B isoform X3 [Equus przewalskii]|uniref:Transmembrane protein 170B n=2 Tax=Equus TaxID=9789 RepID=A0A9L0TI88_HORSE